MESDEFDGDNFDNDLEINPELPLGHMTYQQASYDAYTKIFWFALMDNTIKDRLAFLYFILFKK
jgi:hypothetical protein